MIEEWEGVLKVARIQRGTDKGWKLGAWFRQGVGSEAWRSLGAVERAKTISKELLAMLISVIPTVQPSRYFDPKAAAAPLEYVQRIRIPHLGPFPRFQRNRPIVKQKLNSRNIRARDKQSRSQLCSIIEIAVSSLLFLHFSKPGSSF